MDRRRIGVGRRGEEVAAEYLQRKGYEILERNYRSKWGEVDIIAKDREVLVFVEVKTKTSDSHGAPWEMVSEWKMRQVVRMGEVWVAERRWEGRVRVDVVGVVMSPQEESEVEHYENVTG